MKFNEIIKEQWAENKPYLDTCLLPITGLSGEEQPWEVTEALGKLRDMMDLFEIPFKGRIVTYPALHFINDDPQSWEMIDAVCRNLKKENFLYVIVVTCVLPNDPVLCPSADLWIKPESPKTDIAALKSNIALKVKNMWNSTSVG